MGSWGGWGSYGCRLCQNFDTSNPSLSKKNSLGVAKQKEGGICVFTHKKKARTSYLWKLSLRCIFYWVVTNQDHRSAISSGRGLGSNATIKIVICDPKMGGKIKTICRMVRTYILANPIKVVVRGWGGGLHTRPSVSARVLIGAAGFTNRNQWGPIGGRPPRDHFE